MANLISAHAFMAAYFNSSVADIIEPQDLIIAVNQAAYHAGLMHFDLHDSNYSVSFHLELAKLIQHIPTHLQCKKWKAWALTEVEHKNSSWDYDASLLLSGELDYKDGNSSSIPHWLLLSSCAISAPSAPVVIGPTALVPKVMEPEASSSGVSWPTSIRIPQVSREPTVSSGLIFTFSSSLPLQRVTVVHKHQQETGILAPPLVPLSSVSLITFQWKPIPGSLKFSVPSAPPIDHDTSTPSAVESDRPAGSSPCSVSTPDPASESSEGAPIEAVPSALDSLLSPSLHAYHPLTTSLKSASPPPIHASFQCKDMTVLVASGKPPHSQCMQQSILTVSKAPANMTFHEPLFHQALEYMKLSMLPVAPDSLTKSSA
ncbi:uncharacterized protein BT62DRAFT_922065 [Guyanagaster necrorhizus]|uniref:Uncharacterized protein n=1 Tax=Guyanagaster necrorhizus TaxID=856835 RepID=A0A9P8APS9_9AGAR|nr:uncharacterized protein BT62DRAFT_922065 [Guyanagaster necrorhizus MCA 3950]KAG7443285.1 hypothetical protein BT62DRAFT_922065 [Guyanagaster necrorhizus MCA 3950]